MRAARAASAASLKRRPTGPPPAALSAAAKEGSKFCDRTVLACPYYMEEYLRAKPAIPTWRAGLQSALVHPSHGFGELAVATHVPSSPAASRRDVYPGVFEVPEARSMKEIEADRPKHLRSFRKPFLEHQQAQFEEDTERSECEGSLHRTHQVALRKALLSTQRSDMERVKRFHMSHNINSTTFVCKHYKSPAEKAALLLEKELKGQDNGGSKLSDEEKEKRCVEIFRRIDDYIQKRISNFVTVFREIDKDNSGSLERWELRKALEERGLLVSDGDWQVAMDVIDKDGSGAIEMGEFLDACDYYTRKARGLKDRVHQKTLARTGIELMFSDWGYKPEWHADMKVHDFKLTQDGLH